MSFVPSNHSGYGGWIDDLQNYATSRYDAARSYVSDTITSATETALAPVRAAEEAAAAASARADQVAQAAADARATAEAARDDAASAASAVPWIIGGAVILGLLYMQNRRVRNPETGSWIVDMLTAHADNFGQTADKLVTGEGGRARTYVGGITTGAKIAYGTIPRLLSIIGIPVPA